MVSMPSTLYYLAIVISHWKPNITPIQKIVRSLDVLSLLPSPVQSSTPYNLPLFWNFPAEIAYNLLTAGWCHLILILLKLWNLTLLTKPLTLPLLLWHQFFSYISDGFQKSSSMPPFPIRSSPQSNESLNPVDTTHFPILFFLLQANGHHLITLFSWARTTGLNFLQFLHLANLLLELTF